MSSGKPDFQIPLHYTLVCFFKRKDLSKIVKFLGKINSLDSNQYFYAPSELHLTLFGNMDINSDKDVLIDIIQNFLGQNKIIFHLLGVGSKEDPRSITAYPVNFYLKNLRRQLREVAGGKKLDDVYENLAWINFARFSQKPNQRLISTLEENFETDFGKVEPISIRLLKNSHRLLENAEVVYDF